MAKECNDNSFGPASRGCDRDFDFTLLFENAILSLGPNLLVMVSAAWKLWDLKCSPRVVRDRTFRLLKLILLVLYCVLQTAVLTIWSVDQTLRSWSSIAATCSSLILAASLCLLSFIEHTDSERPSSVIQIYMLFSILLDSARARTLWLLAPSSPLAIIFVASTALKGVILISETHEKEKYLLSPSSYNRPETTSSILNRSTFFWLNAKIWEGASKALRPTDLYELMPDICVRAIHPRFMDAWVSFKKQERRHMSMLAIVSSMRLSILLAVFPRLILLSATMCQPILLNELLDYLEKPTDSVSLNIGYGLIGAYALVYTAIAVSMGCYWYYHFRALTMVRGCLVSALSWQMLKVNLDAMDDPKATVTLMSVDVERILTGLRPFHEFWAMSIQTGLLAYLLERQLGVSFLIPLSVALLSAVVTIWVSRPAGAYQTEWMRAAQLRVGTVSNALASIKTIKMRGLTENISSLVQQQRLEELRLANKFRMLLVWTAGLGYVPQFVSPVLTFLVFILQARLNNGTSFGASRAFTSLSLLMIIAQSMSQTLLDLPELLAAFGSAERIDRFLSIEQQKDFRKFPYLLEKEPTEHEYSDSHPENEDHVPEKSSDHSHLGASRARLQSREPQPLIQINHGSYGRGKGDILEDINVDILRGTLTMIVGPVASGKSTMCQAIIGETSSSKGEIRIGADSRQIAFCDQSAHLSSGTIKKNIVGFSKFRPSWYRTVIHACGLSDDLDDMPEGDNALIGSGGLNVSGGQKQKIALARALYADKPITVLDDILSSLDVDGANHVFQSVMGPDGLAQQQAMTIIFATHAHHYLPYADHVVVLDGGGRVAQQGSFKTLRSQQGYVSGLDVQEQIDSKDANALKYRRGEDTKVEGDNTASDKPLYTETTRPMGDLTVYRHYFITAGIWATFVLLVSVIIYAALYNIPTYWLSVWVRASNTKDLKYWGVYTTFQISALILLLWVAYHTLIRFVTQAGANLHHNLLVSVMNAPMAFFSSTETGVTVNRFSQDFQYIDNELPLAMLPLLIATFLAFGQIILIIASSPWTGLAFLVIVPLFYGIGSFYIRTSRQLRLLEIEAKSPLYTSFLETLSNLPTLRAFGWQSQVFEVHQNLLDESQKPMYLLFMVQRWLAFVLDMIVAAVAVIVVALSVTLRSSGGLTGIALTQIISLSLLLVTIVITWTKVETSIGSVSRMKDFVEQTPSEHRPNEVLQPGWNWPHRGKIEFRNVNASYESKPDSRVLKDLNFTIHPGQKIGLCGRSGSGKSSLLSLLARTLEIQEGSILIDDQDICDLPRNIIRSRLNIIAQDPYFLPGTLRSNLDPHDEFSDHALGETLKKVQLSHLLDHKDALMSDFEPQLLSHGQRQLFCLAKAILRKAKIVLLDEITSNVDQATDDEMQRIIREEFAECTVVAIAHRLHTILDFDQVIVLDKGAVKVIGDPKIVLGTDMDPEKV